MARIIWHGIGVCQKQMWTYRPSAVKLFPEKIDNDIQHLAIGKRDAQKGGTLCALSFEDFFKWRTAEEPCQERISG